MFYCFIFIYLKTDLLGKLLLYYKIYLKFLVTFIIINKFKRLTLFFIELEK
jgi:hypothetical protein